MEWTASQVESHIVSAVWTLRRLPDRESAWLRDNGVYWPKIRKDRIESYGYVEETEYKARRRLPPTSREVDAMQPTLDWLLWLPDLEDRRLVFWAAWHLCGEARKDGDRIPWMRVRSSLKTWASRWTLKRHHDAALNLIAGVLSQRAA